MPAPRIVSAARARPPRLSVSGTLLSNRLLSSRLLGSALLGILLAAALAGPATRAQPASSTPEARIVVSGEGSVDVAPDYAQFTGGVSTRAGTVKEATAANSKAMAAIMAALTQAGIAPRDIQTSRFSIQPVYAPAVSSSPPKLSGYSVFNQVSVKIRHIDKVGDVLDQLVAAGVTDVGNVALLVSEPSKALDQGRATQGRRLCACRGPAARPGAVDQRRNRARSEADAIAAVRRSVHVGTDRRRRGYAAGEGHSRLRHHALTRRRT